MNEQEKRTLIERYLSAYNTFDIEGMMSTVHDDIQFENVAAGEVNAAASGAEELRQMVEKAAELFSFRCQTIRMFEVTEAGATVEIAYEGVLAADLPSGLTTGQTLQLNGRSEFEFKDGKISRIVDYS